MTIPEVTDAQLEDDLDIDVPELENIDFEIGDNVVYPHHGAGQVVKKETEDLSARSASTSRSRSCTTT